MKFDHLREVMASDRKKFFARRQRWAPKKPETYCALVGDVEAASVDKILATLDRYPDAPLTLSINSQGGDVGAAWGLFWRLREHAPEVTTCAGRRCDSAALTIFLAGDIRIAAPTTEFLVHGVAREPQGRPSAAMLGATAEALAALDRQLVNLISMRTGGRYSSWELRADMDREVTLNAHSAMMHGIATTLGR
jgi:ATP-dependent protease ClpP protease subunit